jgi:hypothetical protein
MSVDQLAAFATTPEFFSGLATGALVSRTVRRTIGHFVESQLPGGGES